MKSWNLGLFAVAIAIALVGALWLGLPVVTIAVLGLVLVCPMMMIFMMRGMYGGGGQDQHGSDEGERYDPHDHARGH